MSTYSGSQTVPLALKVREWFKLARMANSGVMNVHGLFTDIADYSALTRQHLGRPLEACRVMEFGYGARPLRQIALHSLGVETFGIDMDTPSLALTPKAVIGILRRNGWERALKTTVRGLAFDARQRGALAQELQSRGFSLQIDSSRLLVGDLTDAAALQVFDSKQRFDLVLSEDVYEHIPAAGMAVAVHNAHRILSRDGMALLRPNVFTGITGGHLPEWYHGHVSSLEARNSEPWEHLRKKRYRANTYLNEFTRADFRKAFSECFILETEIVADPELGAEHFTDQIRNELSAYSDEELFSNRVMWVLRPRDSCNHE